MRVHADARHFAFPGPFHGVALLLEFRECRRLAKERTCNADLTQPMAGGEGKLRTLLPMTDAVVMGTESEEEHSLLDFRSNSYGS